MLFAVLAALSLASTSYALQKGERYDFFCSDGQDVYNAELTGEDAKNFYVKLSPLMAQVPIEKQYVLRAIPKPNVEKPQETAATFELALNGGTEFALGKLGSFAKYAPIIAGTLTFWWRPGFGFFGRVSAEEFRASGAYLRVSGSHAGIWWRLPGTFGNFSALLGAGLGGAYLVGETIAFSETAVVFSVLSTLRLQYSINPRWFLFLEPAATYLYDRETLILLPGLTAGAAWRW